jgi:hypothetical protein
MNQNELKAYVELAAGDKLVDPKYAPHPKTAEEALKARVRKVWHLRDHFPDWVECYIRDWSKEAQDHPGTVRTAGQGDGLASVPGDVERQLPA